MFGRRREVEQLLFGAHGAKEQVCDTVAAMKRRRQVEPVQPRRCPTAELSSGPLSGRPVLARGSGWAYLLPRGRPRPEDVQRGLERAQHPNPPSFHHNTMVCALDGE